MATKTPVEPIEGIYFITFTCQNWLPLFEVTNTYDDVYKWFDHLKTNGHNVRGYVIMPNHLHVIIDFGASLKSINKTISNAKRFLAYEIVRKLQEQHKSTLLLELSQAVIHSDKNKGKKHQVFERSFDCKEITSDYFFRQKLSYIHNNPCVGKWRLANSPIDYMHSSAKFYITGEQGVYLISDE